MRPHGQQPLPPRFGTWYAAAHEDGVEGTGAPARRLARIGRDRVRAHCRDGADRAALVGWLRAQCPAHRALQRRQPAARRIRWQTSVDLRPQQRSGSLLIHYGSPLITQANTVVVPVKRTDDDAFRVEAFSGSDGRPLWRQTSHYQLPPHDWMPSFSPALCATGKLWLPGDGGTLYVARASTGAAGRASSSRVLRLRRPTVATGAPISTTSSSTRRSLPTRAGNVFFGFQVTGPTPASLQSGIARVADGGPGSWVAAATAAGDPASRRWRTTPRRR